MEVPAGDDDGDQDDGFEIKYEHRGQFVEALAQLRDSTRTLNAAHERTQAYFDQRDAEAPAMEEKMKKANAFANDFIARVAAKRKAKERAAEERRRQAEAEAEAEAEAQRLEEAEVTRMEEAPLPNAFEDTATDALDSPDDAINILSDKAEQMSLGGKKTPEMLAREKHRLSEDSKFSKEHRDKKHHTGMEKLPEYTGESDDEEQTAPKSKKRKSVADMLHRASNFGLNFLGMKSAANLDTAAPTETPVGDAAASLGDSAPTDTGAGEDRMEGVEGAGAHLSTGDTHEDDTAGGSVPPPEDVPDRIEDFRVWNGSAYVQLDSFVTPGSQAHEDILAVCRRVNTRIGGHLRKCQEDGSVADRLPECQSCRQINFYAKGSCTNPENLTKKEVCHPCGTAGNHPCCRLIRKPGGYFFGFLPVPLAMRPGFSPDDEFYWKIKKEDKKKTPKPKPTKDTTDKDSGSGKKEGTRKRIERKAKQFGKNIMT